MGESIIRKYAAVTAVLTVLLMTVLDVTLVNVALPVLAGDFGVPDSSSVWIVTIYQLVITILLLPVSAVGDSVSYRRVFLTGVTIFTLASAGCALSSSFASLLVSRALQGFGAACVMGVNIALTRLIYSPHDLPRGLALNAMVIAIATAAGPSLGGLLLAHCSWHWLFAINIPLGVMAFILGARLLPENPHDHTGQSLDFQALLLNALSFGLILYALGSLSREGDILDGVLLLAAGLCAGGWHIRREKRKENPMLPVDLFRSRLYSISITTSTCSFVAQSMASVSLPFLFHSVMGFDIVTTGLLMTPWAICTMLFSPLAASTAQKTNPAYIAAAGMGVFCIGLVSLMTLHEDGASPWMIVWRMCLCGIGFGLYQTPNNIVMVMATPLKRSGAAGGMQSTGRLMGQTTGAALVSLVFFFVSDLTEAVSMSLCTALVFGAFASLLSLCRGPGVSGMRL